MQFESGTLNLCKSVSKMDIMEAGREVMKYELVVGLQSFYSKQWPKFCDFTILCSDGSVPALRTLLEISSEYFQALFRIYPDTKQSDLSHFDTNTIKFLVKAIIDFDPRDLESFDKISLLRLLQAADYLQMKALNEFLSEFIASTISQENINELLALVSTRAFLHSPLLKQACIQFLRENLIHHFAWDVITNQPEDVWSMVLSEPFEPILDGHGRRLDGYIISLIVTTILQKICKKNDKMSEFSKYLKKICIPAPGISYSQVEYAIAACMVPKEYSLPNCTYFDTSTLHSFAKVHLQSLDLQSILNQDLAEDFAQEHPRCLANFPKLFTYVGRQGKHDDIYIESGRNEDGNGRPVIRWNLKGCIRKLDVVTRLWKGRTIVQGLIVYLEDNIPHKCGVNQITDENQVVRLEVPKGEHIKNFKGRSCCYLNQIGFVTNTGYQSPLVGGDGGSPFDTSMLHVWKGNIPGCIRGNFGQIYNDGIRGITVQSDNGICICEIQFRTVLMSKIHPEVYY